MSWGDSQRAVFFDPEGCLTAYHPHLWVDLEVDNQGR